MRLIFINFIGKNYKGVNIYEFLFSEDNVQLVYGEDWDAYPANGSPKSPIDFVQDVFRFETDMELELIQNHETFDMDDCKQGIIALGWEISKQVNEEGYVSRIYFNFGETLDSINKKLYARDLYMTKTTIDV